VQDLAWAALSDPTRRALLGVLLTRPHSVSEMVTKLGVSQPTTSKHLRVLRESGLVQVTGDAQRRIYSIDAVPLADLDRWLAPYRKLWNERLDALGRHLDAKEH
jgi:DNA-binding transcriptional ArsR family regulator